ncbi:chemotaxis protein MotA [Caminicella sporogenes DSM 14501]|uniref:Chemotaxis protein MotA n=1 Tax=Caminicella sporogenes DSM 14501 TaxID=1121266 RepID=A0A1M6LBV5_9FIRM|nr:MotA/TolQ/ExbB proton channel family protein [Caminicella sporogenes]RKD27780.1 flagellar motor protein MotP [Caminicella sporogenes]SHJ68701.1 chemotaxis protein MotA [Caminicella sporogenes DSM 14501]
MDLATIIGIVSGLLLVVWGILGKGSLSWFLDFSSFLIVIGGTIAATFVSFPLDKVLASFKVVKKAFSTNGFQPGSVINKIIDLANVARREGLLALEEAVEDINDEFLQKGVMLIVDGTDPELVKNILETELSFLEERHSEGKSLFDMMGTMAPAFGMIGTLIGLVIMLKQLDDPKSIGPSMAVALITTFYGSLLANLIFVPISKKLKIRSREEILLKEIMIEGLLSIQAGENPRIIEEKLKAFLPPAIRKSLSNDGKTEAGVNE